MDQLPPNWINLGIAGLLAVAFIAAHLHTIKVTIPSLLKTFSQELAKEREENANNLAKLLGGMDNLETAIRGEERPRPFGPFHHRGNRT